MQEIDASIFKAYDIRGTYPQQFDEDVAYRIARAFAQKLKPKLVVVGRDMRTSGPSIMQAATRGLIEQGCDVLHIGLTSTPMFYYAVNHLEANAGLMVTASHNPEEYNGFKMTGPEAIPSIAFVSNDELRTLANGNQFEIIERKGHLRGEVSVLEDYATAVFNASGVTDLGNLKIVVDASNGMDGMILPRLFHGKNCTVVPLYWELDGRFPHHEPDPLKVEMLADLRARVLEENADLGVMFDGDGDRVGFVDEEGQPIPGDMITALIAREILQEKPGAKIVYEVRSSWAVREEIEKAGGEPVIYKAGHGLIKRYMREIGACFGGELSGHYFFADFFITDNGDLAMLKIIQLLVSEKKSLSELARPIMRYHHSPEINFHIPDMAGKLAEIKKRYGDGHIMEVEGVTVEYPGWWFNVRPSQTEPLIRLNVEAKTKRTLKEKVKELSTVIQS